MERLQGTSIKTSIKTGGQHVKEGFGLIERWKIIEKSPDGERMIAIEVTLPEWALNRVWPRSLGHGASARLRREREEIHHAHFHTEPEGKSADYIWQVHDTRSGTN
jgi:hypothetical protein